MIVHVAGVSTHGLYIKCMICMLRLVHEDYRTWGLYTKFTICMLQVLVHCDGIICTICMFQVLVHDGCIICTNCMLWAVTIIFRILTVLMEYHIIVLITRNFVFQRSIVSVWILFLMVSAELFAVWVSIHGNWSLEVVSFYPWQLISWGSEFLSMATDLLR